MKYVLAIVSFVIAAPLLLFGGMNLYGFIHDNGVFNFQAMRELWQMLAAFGAALLLGFMFFIAGVAILVVKPRR